MAAQDLVNTQSALVQIINGVNRKYDARSGRKGRISCRANEISGAGLDEFESWSQVDDLRIELQARKQREEALEDALAEKEFVEDDYRKKVEEAKKREAALENDKASMWVLVANLKKEVGVVPEANIDKKNGDGEAHTDDLKINEIGSNTIPKELLCTASDLYFDFRHAYKR